MAQIPTSVDVASDGVLAVAALPLTTYGYAESFQG